MDETEEKVPQAEAVTEEEKPKDLEDLTAPGAKPETRVQRLLRQALRWIVGFLIVFGLGVLATVFLVYQPTRLELTNVTAQLDQANQQITQVQDEFNQQINQMQGEIDNLKPLETQNKDLQDQLNQANLHIVILSSLSDVNAARLALANDDQAGAKVHLTNTPQTLSDLKSMVGSNQMEKVASMEDRLQLAISEMSKNIFAAKSDLSVLAEDLVQLENTFFATP